MKIQFTKRPIGNEITLYLYKGDKCVYFDEGYMVGATCDRHRCEEDISMEEFLAIFTEQNKETYPGEKAENLTALVKLLIS